MPYDLMSSGLFWVSLWNLSEVCFRSWSGLLLMVSHFPVPGFDSVSWWNVNHASISFGEYVFASVIVSGVPFALAWAMMYSIRESFLFCYYIIIFGFWGGWGWGLCSIVFGRIL